MIHTHNRLFISCACALATTLGLAASPAFVLAIAPGDIIFTEFYDGWHKLDPATGVVTQLPWDDSSIFTETIRFDTNGAVLVDDAPSAIHRINPANGHEVDLHVPGISLIDGFVVEDSGDLLIANSGEVSRFTRSAGVTSTVTTSTFFSPNGIARGADGRVFITEFFEDLWEVSPTTGARSTVTGTDLSIPGLIAVRSDGDLIVENFSPGVLYRIDPDTGAVSLFTDDLPSIVNGFALDSVDNLWLTATDGLYRYDASGGPKTLVYTETFFNPSAIAVVPDGWTFHDIPEPGAACLAGVFATIMTTASRPRRRRCSLTHALYRPWSPAN